MAALMAILSVSLLAAMWIALLSLPRVLAAED
jgi:hypothetical protein